MLAERNIRPSFLVNVFERFIMMMTYAFGVALLLLLVLVSIWFYSTPPRKTQPNPLPSADVIAIYASASVWQC